MKTSTTLLVVAGVAAAGGIGWWFYKNKYLRVLQQRDQLQTKNLLDAAGNVFAPRQCAPGYVSNPPYFDCIKDDGIIR